MRGFPMFSLGNADLSQSVAKISALCAEIADLPRYL
jgi:hypothetical protein